MLATLSQLLLGAAMAGPSRSAMAGPLQKIIIGLLGIVAACLIGVFALVVLVIAGVLWVAPPGTPLTVVCLLTAGVLLAVAVFIWQAVSGGQGPRQIIREALGEPTTPTEYVTQSVNNVLDAFQRGWHRRG